MLPYVTLFIEKGKYYGAAGESAGGVASGAEPIPTEDSLCFVF